MPTGKSIRIYLADATVTGVRFAELVNWTGQGLACPRNRLSDLANWSEASKPGVYFLFEGRSNDTKSLAYIGESENVLERLTTHDRQKEFWSEVVIFSSKDDNLTKAHVKYLESSLVALAKDADRYQLENGNIPTASSLPRADRDAMEEFIENSRMVLGVLGYTILEPLLPSNRQRKDGANAIELDSRDSPLMDLSFTISGLVARGALTNEGFVLKKGAQLSKGQSESMPTKLASLKAQLITEGSLIECSDYFLANSDLLLSSSSYAAALVAGTSRSGPQSWKTSDGQTLKQKEDASLLIK
ncbi:putative endonuclease [Herbaspirillum sp. CF444]|uniref:GIY-YIG nuclease family protein n=1 Tax=Herbaspirillum sp. CF444 TaxID=1144319 RepID=UPI0002725DFE|nr:GIY-YIG nuclease family protein [Herbaspirillum sp. CF444]EJL84345.1 putative endonuclease [Herbaspirillum sp. CF444]